MKRRNRAAEDFGFVLSMLPPNESEEGDADPAPQQDGAPAATDRDLRRLAWQNATKSDCTCEEAARRLIVICAA